MAIQFFCPNGHPLSAPNKQAGKPGRCPKCEVAYVTPQLEAEEERGSPVTQGNDQGEGQFEFLCPNGHRIKAMESSAGQPGKCPECGERFRVPVLGQDGVGEQAAASEAGDRQSTPAPSSAAPARWTVPAELRQGDHGLAEVMRWIWDEKDAASECEIILKDGTTLRIERYAPELSSSSTGLVGLRGDEGTVAMMAISWNAVAAVRIVCREEVLADVWQRGNGT